VSLHTTARWSVAALVAGILSSSSTARGQAGPPGAHEDAAFDIMNLLAHNGLHDIDQEPWNAYGQFTYISSWKLPFSAAYTNANGSTKSLIPDAERSFTGTFTLFLGMRLWKGAELYVVPNVVRRSVSDLARARRFMGEGAYDRLHARGLRGTPNTRGVIGAAWRPGRRRPSRRARDGPRSRPSTGARRTIGRVRSSAGQAARGRRRSAAP
jgi:hypothetical protein